MHLSPSALSVHLAKLTTVGLMTRRRSGAWSYCAAKSPYGATTLSGQVSAWLCELLAKPEQALQGAGFREARRLSPVAVDDQLHRLIFEAATAFTDLRRLQILRLLSEADDATTESLRETLKMSAWAVARHTRKLIRRGYLCRCLGGEPLSYRLTATGKTPVHTRLWEIVRSAWRETRLRTS